MISLTNHLTKKVTVAEIRVNRRGEDGPLGLDAETSIVYEGLEQKSRKDDCETYCSR